MRLVTTEGRWRARRDAWLDRFWARVSAMGKPAGGFLTEPEPRAIGSLARGRQICEGSFLMAGHLVQAPGAEIWALTPPDPAFADELHGFSWLDDLAAVGTPEAAELARRAVQGWIARYGRGSGPGWRADLAGRRLTAWIAHGALLLAGGNGRIGDPFFAAISAQARFLSRRARRAPAGLPRIEALAGLTHAAAGIEGLSGGLDAAAGALGAECAALIDPLGGIPSRNPEELAEIFAMLTWTAKVLRGVDHPVPEGIETAISRAAPALRALRHADGELARFHGGGRGIDGRLDQALAESGVRGGPASGLVMGFARLSHGRTTLIMDAASPPRKAHSAFAHASTLAFELTSNRRALIVNCGSGRSFGERWRRAGRATPSHSTLAIDHYSSARLGEVGLGSGRKVELLLDAPRDVRLERRENDLASGLIAGHDGYLRTHGLTHVRQLHLGRDGRTLQGEDVLATLERADEARFDAALDQTGLRGVPFRIRFHLHPEVDAELDLGGTAVSLALRSGEIWVFRHTGAAQLLLEPSVYLERGRLAPRATRQIVLASAATDYATRVSWTLAKARETPDALRDTAPSGREPFDAAERFDTGGRVDPGLARPG